MDPVRWQHVKELFAAASLLEGPQRDTFLDVQCAQDGALRAEVASLLLAASQAGTFMDAPPVDPPEALPKSVGPWEILRELGRGGMGNVYLARRADGVFHKDVALKLVRRGLDTDDLLARFRAERQILAALDHPNVARLLDGGATEDGRPYFVMEYVEGEDLLSWCTHRELGVPGRLALFQQLCSAVQYAHRNLVVHRDIKPANVWVTADGTPKLLDFGIAKLLSPGDADRPPQTRTGYLPLTPAYASPEQLRGERVTTASDVWALGVLLYELLSGEHPFHTDSVDIARAISERDPIRPSAAVLKSRGDSPEGRRWARALEGDLDNVVLTALRKDPEKRYGSPEQLADDLQRHVSGMPVRARPPSLRYWAGKFVRRHQWSVAAGALVTLSLVGGAGATVWQARKADEQRGRAEATRARAEELVDFMLGDLRSKLEPSNRLEVLDDVARAVEAYFASLPADEAPSRSLRRARVLQQLTSVRLAQGRLDEAAAFIADSRKLLAALGDLKDNAETRRLLAGAAYLEGRVREERGDLEGALTQNEIALELFRDLARGLNPPDATAVSLATEAANDCGRILYFLNRPADAAVRHREALAMFEGLPIPKGEVGLSARYRLSKSWLYLGRADEGTGDPTGAEHAFRRALALAQEVASQAPDDIEKQDFFSVTQNDLGRLLRFYGRPGEAEKLHAAALARSEELLRRDPNNTLRADSIAAGHSFMGRAKEDQGDLVGALEHFAADAKISEQSLSKAPENAIWKAAFADALTNVGRVERRMGNLSGALAHHQRALKLREDLSAAAPGDTAAASDVGFSRLEIGRVRAASGETSKAQEDWEAARTSFAAAVGSSPSTKQRSRLVQALLELGRIGEARTLVEPFAKTGSVDPELRVLARAKGLKF